MPFANTQQLLALLRHTLMQSSAVAGIVGGRIYGAHLHTPDTRSTVFPLVIAELEGGAVGMTSSYQEQIMFLYCYSRDSLGEAGRLYDACHDALHHQLLKRTGNPVAGYALEQQRPEQGWNEQIQAHYARGLYTLRTTTGDS